MRGGYRQGSGRKKGYAAKNAEEARRVFAELVSAEIEPIARALIKKAKQGDIQAVRELLDRAYGKPAQPTNEKNIFAGLDIREMVATTKKRYSGGIT